MAVLVALCVAAAVVARDEDPRPPTAVRPTSARDAAAAGMRVSAWLPYWDDGSGLASLEVHGKSIDAVHLFWFEARSADEISVQAKKTGTAVEVARRTGTKVVATITEKLGPRDFGALLADASQRSRHARAVCDLAVRSRFDGVDLDYESFALGAVPGDVDALAQGYVALVSEVAGCLHHEHKALEVTVVARVGPTRYSPGSSDMASGVFDYGALGKVVDVLRPMAYDFHYPGGPPGSVAPLGWVQAVAEYAAKEVPRRKLDLAVPLYGEDWRTAKATASPVTAARAPALVASAKAAPVFDDATKSNTFDYVKDGEVHHVWFDDTRATEWRIGVARSLGLRGVSFWALGYESADLWR